MGALVMDKALVVPRPHRHADRALPPPGLPAVSASNCGFTIAGGWPVRRAADDARPLNSVRLILGAVTDVQRTLTVTRSH